MQVHTDHGGWVRSGWESDRRESSERDHVNKENENVKIRLLPMVHIGS